MTIAEIKEKLSQERGFGSRYPARIVFVENLDDYSALEHQLKGICDVTMNVADFCRAPDTVPQFDQFKNKLKECEGQQVLLLSVGEYLRMCMKREKSRPSPVQSILGNATTGSIQDQSRHSCFQL